jgi:hypothetical protein
MSVGISSIVKVGLRVGSVVGAGGTVIPSAGVEMGSGAVSKPHPIPMTSKTPHHTSFKLTIGPAHHQLPSQPFSPGIQ